MQNTLKEKCRINRSIFIELIIQISHSRRWVIFLCVIAFSTVCQAGVLVGDPSAGIAFFSYGRMAQLCRFEAVDQRSIPQGSYRVKRAYFPPRITLPLPFTPPWVIELENGIMLSNDAAYADILIQEDHHQMPWLDSIDEIIITHFPWYLEGDRIHVARREYLEYLPAYLREMGYDQWVEPLMARVIENDDSFVFFLGPADYSVELTLLGAVETLPLIMRYRSDRPIAQIHWSIDESEPMRSPASLTIPMHTRELVVKAYSEDVFGHHAEAEIAVRPQPVSSPVQRVLHFERIGVGQTLLFPGRMDGVWHVMDQRVRQQNLRWHFEVSGEYTLYQTSPGRILTFRVWVRP